MNCRPTRSVLSVPAIVAWALCWTPVGTGTAHAELPHSGRYLGTLSCSSVSCHGSLEPRKARGSIALQEYLTWMERDPHARSVATIWSDRFQNILAQLGALEGGRVNRDTYLRCARCHDPLAAEPLAQVRDQKSTVVALTDLRPRGMGCESCHGPAGNWLSSHFRRGVATEELTAAGMTPLQDLEVRARVCASCHIGTEDHDMNHDMIAAGHPPLRFELASYHDRLPKHWGASAERRATPDFQARLWEAGQLAAADATLRLLHGRALRAQYERGQPAEETTRHPWPEFSTTSCFACHQRFGRGKSPAVHWDDWNLAYASLIVQHRRPESTPHDGFRKSLTQLNLLMSGPSAFDPEPVRVAGEHVISQLASAMRPAEPNRRPAISNRDLIGFLLEARSPDLSWELATQHFLALVAAERAFQDEWRKHADSIAGQRRKEWYWDSSAVNQRLNRLRQALAFDDNRDLPQAMLASGQERSGESFDLNQIAAELNALTVSFQQRQQEFDKWRAPE